MSPQKSRLARNVENQTKKQITLYLVGIIILIFVVFKFGPAVIGEIGNLIYTLRGEKQQVNNYAVDFLEPPTLEDLPQAVENPDITIKGKSAYTDGTIEIFVDSKSYKKIRIDDDGKFELSHITLSEGDNTIKARVKVKEDVSDFSDEFVVKFAKEAPKLDDVSPSDGTSFSKADQQIQVTGKTESDNTVTVNEFRAIVDSEGKFSYYLKLNDGDNEIKIVAENLAGKKTEKIIKVKYSP